MTDLVASGLLGDPAVDVADFQTGIEQLRDFSAELPGGGARTELTISAGAIVPPSAAGGGVHTVDTEGNAATDDLTTITTTNTPEGRFLMLRAENASRVVTLKDAGGASGQMLMYDSADFVLDALDKWILFHLESTDWVEVCRSYGVDHVEARLDLGVPMHLGENILSPHERLRIDYATAATVTIQADAVILKDTDGNQLRYTSVNETLTISSTGAGGRDVTENAGAEKASDWYHIWLIGKDDGTVDAFAALACFPGGSSIYSVLPAGYTHAGYYGAVYNNGSSNFTDFWQRGNIVTFGVTQVVTSGALTSRTAVSLTAAVPDTHRRIFGNAAATPSGGSTAATAILSPDAASATGEVSLQFTPAGAGGSYVMFEMLPRVAQEMGYRVSAGDTLDVWITGWEY